MSGESTTQPARRPREVWTVTIMLTVFGGLATLQALLLLSFLRADASHGESVSGVAYAVLAVALVLAVAQILSGVFVFRGVEWARKLAIGICVLNALSGLLLLTSGALFQAILGIVVNIAIITNLNRSEVREWTD
jgi:hypothetical protein